MGIGDEWGTADELAHPRGPDGRWIKKGAGIKGSALSRVLGMLGAFRPRMFQSDNQAAQYNLNRANAHSARMNQPDYARLAADWDNANNDLVDGVPDEPSTKKFVQMMDANMQETEVDLIATQILPPETFGFTAATMNGTDADNPGIRGMAGKLVASRGYSSVSLGNGLAQGSGQITLTMAVPKGTRVAIPGRGQTDREMILDRDQPVRITKVRPDGRGGFQMMALAEPKRADQTPEAVSGPRGAGSADREGDISSIAERQARREGVVPDSEIQAREAARTAPPAAAPEGTGGAPAPAEAAPAAPGTPVPDNNQPTPQQPLPDGTQPRQEQVVSEGVGGEPGADTVQDPDIPAETPTGDTPAADTEPVAAPEPVAPTPTPAPPPEDADVQKQRLRREAKERYRTIARATPIAEALQGIDELREKKASNDVIAEHIEGILSSPVMDEVPKESVGIRADLQDMVRDFRAGKPNLAKARMTRAQKSQNLTMKDKAGSVVDFDEATMDPVGDIPEDGKVQIIKPAVTMRDMITGRDVLLRRAETTTPTPAAARKAARRKAAPAAPATEPGMTAFARPGGDIGAGPAGGMVEGLPSERVSAPEAPASPRALSKPVANMTDAEVQEAARNMSGPPQNDEEVALLRRAAEVGTAQQESRIEARNRGEATDETEAGATAFREPATPDTSGSEDEQSDEEFGEAAIAALLGNMTEEVREDFLQSLPETQRSELLQYEQNYLDRKKANTKLSKKEQEDQKYADAAIKAMSRVLDRAQARFGEDPRAGMRSKDVREVREALQRFDERAAEQDVATPPAKKAAPKKAPGDLIAEAILGRLPEDVRKEVMEDMPPEVPAKKAVPKKATAPEAGPKPLDKMLKAELLAHAKENGVDVRPSWTKPKILEAIRAKESGTAPKGALSVDAEKAEVAAAGREALDLLERDPAAKAMAQEKGMGASPYELLGDIASGKHDADSARAIMNSLATRYGASEGAPEYENTKAKMREAFAKVSDRLTELPVRTIGGRKVAAPRKAAPAKKAATAQVGVVDKDGNFTPVADIDADITEQLRKTTVKEIRDAAAAEGFKLKGRTKPDLINDYLTQKARKQITDTAVTETKSAPDPEIAATAARNRQADIDNSRKRGAFYAELSEFLANEADQAAIQNRIRAGATRFGFSDMERERYLKAAREGNLDRLIAEQEAADNLRALGTAGDITTFDPAKHEAFGGKIAPGTRVRIMRPGHAYNRDREDIELSKPRVVEWTDEDVAEDDDELFRRELADEAEADTGDFEVLPPPPPVKKAAEAAATRGGIPTPEELRGMGSVAEAEEALAPLLGVELKAIAAKMNLPVKGLSKEDTKKAIIRLAVQSRLEHAAFKDLGEKPPRDVADATPSVPEVEAASPTAMGGKIAANMDEVMGQTETAMASAADRASAETVLKGLLTDELKQLAQNRGVDLKGKMRSKESMRNAILDADPKFSGPKGPGAPPRKAVRKELSPEPAPKAEPPTGGRTPGYLTRQEAVRATLGQRPTKRTKLNGGNSTTERVEFDDGSSVIEKDASARDLDAEELSAEIVDALGMEGAAVVRTSPTTLRMELIQGPTGTRYIWDHTGSSSVEETERLAQTREGRLMGLLDAITLNAADRGGANWIVRDGRPVPIDHGIAFVTDDIGFIRMSPFSQRLVDRDWAPTGPRATWVPNDYSPEDMAILEPRLRALEPRFQELGHQDWFDQMMERFAGIRAQATGSERLL